MGAGIGFEDTSSTSSAATCSISWSIRTRKAGLKKSKSLLKNALNVRWYGLDVRPTRWQALILA
jgi:hypothetical protein